MKPAAERVRRGRASSVTPDASPLTIDPERRAGTPRSSDQSGSRDASRVAEPVFRMPAPAVHVVSTAWLKGRAHGLGAGAGACTRALQGRRRASDHPAEHAPAPRGALIDELARYGERGEFPANRDYVGRRMPYFCRRTGSAVCGGAPHSFDGRSQGCR